MSRMPDKFVDLTVTSPPYDGLRTYKGYEFDFEAIAKELYRVTKDGGVVVWVVGDETINGSETGTSFRQALYFKDVCGFNLHDTMIYLKTGFNNPATGRYHQVFEYMFVFSNGKPAMFNPIKDRENAYLKRGGRSIRQKDGKTKKGFGGQFLEQFGQRYNVWMINHYGKSGEQHPATFPEKLAVDHILSWSNEGDLVYDPMIGSGTTAKAALMANRQYIGSEISKEYVDIAEKRISLYTQQLRMF
jgi:site-specific DNA-methyltransferase (adenine-specific)